jgi:hypothetical protein
MIFKMVYNAQELNHPVLIRTHTNVKKCFAEKKPESMIFKMGYNAQEFNSLFDIYRHK